MSNSILAERSFGTKATIKLPCTPDGLKVCKYLTSKGTKVNMTLVFSVSQAILCALAGATYVSPFVGRMDDNSLDGLGLIADISNIYQKLILVPIDTLDPLLSLKSATPATPGD